MRFSSLHGNEFDACSPDRQFGAATDGNVRLEAAHVVNAEALAEEILVENAGLVDVVSDFVGVIASRVKTRAGTQGAKIRMPAHMIPVRVRDEDGCQWGQLGRIRPQCLVSGPGRVRPGAGIDPDQLPPIVRHYEVVFRELKTREYEHATGNDFADAPRGEGMPGYDFLRKRSAEGDRPVEVFVAGALQIVLRPSRVAIRQGELSQVIVDSPQPSCM